MELSDSEVLVKILKHFENLYPEITFMSFSVHPDGSCGICGKGLDSNKHEEIFDIDGSDIKSFIIWSKEILNQGSST